MFKQFNAILFNWSHDLADKNLNIESIIQFGSTCKEPIKKETDVDLLYILNEKKPLNRFESYALTKNWDADLENKVKIFKDHNIIVNSHTKVIAQLNHLSPMYLDFMTHGKILFDRTDTGKRLFNNIQSWIAKTGAQRIQKGNLWYWIYDDQDPKLPVNFKF